MEAQRCGAVDQDLLGKHYRTLALLQCDLAAQAAKLACCTVLLQGPGGGPNDKGLSRKHIIEGTKVHD